MSYVLTKGDLAGFDLAAVIKQDGTFVAYGSYQTFASPPETIMLLKNTYTLEYVSVAGERVYVGRGWESELATIVEAERALNGGGDVFCNIGYV